MDHLFLLEALKQAYLGRGRCAPNPSVGAVAVRQGEIIARDFHKGAGTPHAEVLVFKQLPSHLDDVTLYVTLEPCNHWGRTPPCVDAIIARGVREVIYGYTDPNPVVQSNDTPSILAEHGIQCRHVPLPEINDFYESYSHWCHTQKPFVTAKIAQTLDGKIAQTEKISNESCDAFTQQQRQHSDLILTSMRTVNNDDPLFNARIDGISYAKDIAIIDSELQLRPQARIFDSTKSIHIYHATDKKPYLKHEKMKYHPISSDHKGLNLQEIIHHLGELGYHDVWVEAGATLFAALHEAHLVDRTYIYVVPITLGDKSVNAYPTNIFNKQTAEIACRAIGTNSLFCINWRRM